MKVIQVKNTEGVVVGDITPSFRAHILGVGFSSFNSAEEAEAHILKVTSETIYITSQAQEILVESEVGKKKKLTFQEKIVKSLKFLPRSEDPALVSVDPLTILGSKELWVYNVKTRKLGVYVALKDDYLKVKKSKILNWDPDKSVEKTLRKPEEVLPIILQGTSSVAHVRLDGIKAKIKELKGRINTDTILMKVF